MKRERHERRGVTRAIKLALTQIADQDPELGRLLSKSIKTGRYLRYSPGSAPSPGRKSRRARKTPLWPGRNRTNPALNKFRTFPQDRSSGGTSDFPLGRGFSRLGFGTFQSEAGFGLNRGPNKNAREVRHASI